MIRDFGAMLIVNSIAGIGSADLDLMETRAVFSSTKHELHEVSTDRLSGTRAIYNLQIK